MVTFTTVLGGRLNRNVVCQDDMQDATFPAKLTMREEQREAVLALVARPLGATGCARALAGTTQAVRPQSYAPQRQDCSATTSRIPHLVTTRHAAYRAEVFTCRGAAADASISICAALQRHARWNSALAAAARLRERTREKRMHAGRAEPLDSPPHTSARKWKARPFPAGTGPAVAPAQPRPAPRTWLRNGPTDATRQWAADTRCTRSLRPERAFGPKPSTAFARAGHLGAGATATGRRYREQACG
eukprot:144254-Chlamydomonas_euryale.AAC.1